MRSLRKLDRDTPGLMPLVKSFKSHLSALNKTAGKKTDEAAKRAIDGYFKPGKTVFGSFEEGKLVGYCVVFEQTGVFWLEWLFVHGDHRGEDHASLLFDTAERFAKKHGEDQLYVWVHPDNHAMMRFLNKKGYDTLNLIEVTKRKKKTNETLKVFGHKLNY